jgi:hypothetical protein
MPDFRMESGMPLFGYWTFAECAKARGWFATLAKMGKPTQIVGKVLSEADLHKVRA